MTLRGHSLMMMVSTCCTFNDTSADCGLTVGETKSASGNICQN